MGLRDLFRSPEPPVIPTITVCGVELPDTSPEAMSAYLADLAAYNAAKSKTLTGRIEARAEADGRRRLDEEKRRQAARLQRRLDAAAKAEAVPAVPVVEAEEPELFIPGPSRYPKPAPAPLAPVSPAPVRQGVDRPLPPPVAARPVSPSVTPRRDTPEQVLDRNADQLLAYLRQHEGEMSLSLLARRWGHGREGVHEDGANAALRRLRELGAVVKDGGGGAPLRLKRS